MTPAPNRVRVLIVARERVIAALLGLLVESERFEPIFPSPDESAEDAVARVRPGLIVMLDGTLDAASSDIFFAKAGRARARVILLAPPMAVTAHSTGDATRDAVLGIAHRRSVPSIDVTASRDEIAHCLDQLAHDLF